MNLDFEALSAWDIASFLRLQKIRSLSRPARCHRGISWLARSLGYTWPLKDALVMAQCNGSTVDSTATPLPVQAECPTLEMLRKMEEVVFTGEFVVLKIYAGFIALLAHGCLRFADAQHSEDLYITSDAIIGTGWRVKKCKRKVLWAALRVGISARDWGAEWLAVLAEVDLPAKDFILKAPTPDLRGLTERIASYDNVACVMRAILMMTGMSAGEAVRYTPHSWRHLYPTLGRQLNLPESQLNEVGHWAPGSGMPRRYDAAACVSELAAKASITGAIASGWTPVGPGCVPRPAPATPSCKAPATPQLTHAPGSARVKKLRTSPRANSRVKDHSDEPLLQSFQPVLHRASGKIHCYLHGSTPVCGTWTCGSTAMPVAKAAFQVAEEELQRSTWCKSCRGSRLTSLVGADAEEEFLVEPSSTSSSSSSSSSS